MNEFVVSLPKGMTSGFEKCCAEKSYLSNDRRILTITLIQSGPERQCRVLVSLLCLSDLFDHRVVFQFSSKYGADLQR